MTRAVALDCAALVRRAGSAGLSERDLQDAADAGKRGQLGAAAERRGDLSREPRRERRDQLGLTRQAGDVV